VLPTQKAQRNPIMPRQGETYTGPYSGPRCAVLPLFSMQKPAGYFLSCPRE